MGPREFETANWKKMTMHFMTNGIGEPPTCLINCLPGIENWIKMLNIGCQVVTENFDGKSVVKTTCRGGDLEKNKRLPLLKIGFKIGEGEFCVVHLGEYKGQKVAAKILKKKKGSKGLAEMYRELIIQSYFYYP